MTNQAWKQLFAVCSLALAAFAQTSGTVRGTVRAADGTPLAGVKIELIEAATGKVHALLSDAQGAFVEPLMPPGRFQVKARAEKWRAYDQNNIDLAVGQQLNLRLVMRAETEEAATVVESGQGQLNLSSGTISVTVDKAQMRDLPLNGRSFEQLALLQPGITGAYSAGSSFYGARGRAISINGARPEQNSFLLDGTDMMNAFNKTPGSAAGVLLGVEGVLEYQVLTNAYGPEFGRAPGGVINAATRSGSNRFEGTLFYFHRNSAMDAKNFFNPAGEKIPGFKRNQFGGVFGGPLAKDRTFFFASYEKLIERLGVISSAAVPDAEARRGVLPTGNVAINPVMRPYLDTLFPAANGRSLGGGAAEFLYSLSQPTGDNFYQLRLDHRFSERDSFFARYTLTEGEVDRVPVNTLPVARLRETGRNQYVGAEWVRMLTPSLFFANRLGFTRAASSALNARTIPDLDRLSFVPGAPFGFVTITGMANSIGGDARIPREDYFNNYQWTNSAVYMRGRHSMKFGWNGQRQQFNTHNLLQLGGAVTFANLADFLRGTARSIDFSIPGQYDPVRGFRQTLLASY